MYIKILGMVNSTVLQNKVSLYGSNHFKIIVVFFFNVLFKSCRYFLD